MIRKPSYQITSHPLGSLKEIWAISWPLILSFFSTGMMIFVDRIMLGHYSIRAMNASATAGSAALSCLLLPMIIAGISEVFVGRYNGEGKLSHMGRAVWQMIWFSVFAFPLFILMAYLAPGVLFKSAQSPELNTQYFFWMVLCGPFFCLSKALAGFYIGQGKFRIISLGVLAANLANIGLDYCLIFGTPWTPSWGIKGAALATVSTEAMMSLTLFLMFIQKKNRKEKGTGNLKIKFALFFQSVKRGFAASLAHLSEYIGEYVLLICFNGVSENQLTIMVILHTLYNLIFFIIEGISKGLSVVASNLIGAKRFDFIPKALRSSLILHILFVLITTVCILGFSPHIFSGFVSAEESVYFLDPLFLGRLYRSSICLCFFYLFDGIVWNLAGILVASSDNRFIMTVGTFVPWLIEIVPIYLGITYFNLPVDQAWLYMVISSAFVTALYWFRYKSKPWLKPAAQNEDFENLTI